MTVCAVRCVHRVVRNAANVTGKLTAGIVTADALGCGSLTSTGSIAAGSASISGALDAGGMATVAGLQVGPQDPDKPAEGGEIRLAASPSAGSHWYADVYANSFRLHTAGVVPLQLSATGDLKVKGTATVEGDVLLSGKLLKPSSSSPTLGAYPSNLGVCAHDHERAARKDGFAATMGRRSHGPCLRIAWCRAPPVPRAHPRSESRIPPVRRSALDCAGHTHEHHVWPTSPEVRRHIRSTQGRRCSPPRREACE